MTIIFYEIQKKSLFNYKILKLKILIILMHNIIMFQKTFIHLEIVHQDQHEF